MTSTNGPDRAGRSSRGIIGSARRITVHVRALAQLQRELAKAELQRKGGTVGAGAAVYVAAGIFALFAIGFGLATIAAALALVIDWWLALLIVFVALVLLVVALLLVARSLVRAGTPLKPEQALAEAQLTKEVLRSARGE